MVKVLEEDKTDYYTTNGQTVKDYVDEQFKRFATLTHSDNKLNILKIKGSMFPAWFRVLIDPIDETIHDRYFNEARNQVLNIKQLKLELETRGYPVETLFKL